MVSVPTNIQEPARISRNGRKRCKEQKQRHKNFQEVSRGTHPQSPGHQGKEWKERKKETRSLETPKVATLAKTDRNMVPLQVTPRDFIERHCPLPAHGLPWSLYPQTFKNQQEFPGIAERDVKNRKNGTRTSRKFLVEHIHKVQDQNRNKERNGRKGNRKKED